MPIKIYDVIVTNIKIVSTDSDISCVIVTNIKIMLWDDMYWYAYWLGPEDLILFTLLLELLDLNLNAVKVKWNFRGTFGAVLHHV